MHSSQQFTIQVCRNIRWEYKCSFSDTSKYASKATLHLGNKFLKLTKKHFSGRFFSRTNLDCYLP